MNNNPFSSEGEIGRVSFVVTTILLSAVLFIALVCVDIAGHDPDDFIIHLFSIPWLVLCCFAIMKRMRHIGRQNLSLGWLGVGLLIPVILWLYLAFKEGADACTAPRPVSPQDMVRNNNPFSFRGRIGRGVYALTTILVSVISFVLICLSIVPAGSEPELHAVFLLIVFLLIIPLALVTNVFAIMKRLRDIGMEHVRLGYLSWGSVAPIILWIYLIGADSAEARAKEQPATYRVGAAHGANDGSGGSGSAGSGSGGSGSGAAPSPRIDLEKQPASQPSGNPANPRGLLK